MSKKLDHFCSKVVYNLVIFILEPTCYKLTFRLTGERLGQKSCKGGLSVKVISQAYSSNLRGNMRGEALYHYRDSVERSNILPQISISSLSLLLRIKYHVPAVVVRKLTTEKLWAIVSGE